MLTGLFQAMRSFTLDKAFVLTNGRYFLQAEESIGWFEWYDSIGFEILRLTFDNEFDLMKHETGSS